MVSNIRAVDPKKLFLIDSAGALLSAMMLGFVLTRFEHVFGMPQKVLYTLSSLACILFIFSLSCFLREVGNWRRYMKGIAVANLFYCCITTVLVAYLNQELTALGLGYFVLEIIVIATLATFELKMAFHGTYTK